MKYEMIFGDEKLFDGAPLDSVCVERFINTELASVYVHHRTIDALLNTFIEREAVSCVSNRPDIAIRRIIKEPKRWTWEDKRAGRLPEVGCIVEYFKNNEHDDTEVTAQWCNGDKLEILRHQNENKAFVVFNTRTELSGNLIVQCMKPIETPAEKAQREEDEFVSGIVFEYDKMPSSVLFEAGIRAAYRKIKGGE